MARPRVLEPVKLFMSLFTGDAELMGVALRRLAERYGPVGFLSDQLPFDHTDYYREEFGGELFRKIVAFELLMEPEKLTGVKLATNALEDEFVGPTGRRINIDPGYVVLDKVVLLSCKNFSHRLYLGEGVFGEVTLIYRRGKGFVPLDWTYPDYQSSGVLSILEDIRLRYGKQVELND